MPAERDTIWQPPPELIADAALTRYAGWLTEAGFGRFSTYEDLWQWSVEDLERFWTSIWEVFDVPGSRSPGPVLASRSMPGARWFEGSTLNYAEAALGGGHADDACAIESYREDGEMRSVSRGELAAAVGAAAAGLRRLGVGRGDRVAAYLPNVPEAVIGFLATASIGAVWSSCSPDFGPRAVVDRFGQIEPTVLLAVVGYRYGGRWFDRRDALSEIVEGLPGVTVVLIEDGAGDHELLGGDVVSWGHLLSAPADVRFEQVGFEDPLWVLFSSGTTGLPKSMVQGHGGIVLEHLKSLALHLDLSAGDRFCWFTTTGWMMWNFLVSGLLVGATIVLYDGSPAYPDLGALWRLVDRAELTYLGSSAPFIHASMRVEVEPRSLADLSTLRAIGSTGAPLSPEGFGWINDRVGSHVWLGSISGGTDLCTAVVTSCPWLPVRAGEIQCRALGAKVESFDPDGHPTIGEVGELVITEPMPSMPVSFWNDPGGERYRASYFERYPGVWRHGDWITIAEDGSCVISGRSDATLNRGGVRIGTSEFYRVVESLPEVAGALVIDTGDLERDGEIILFVVPEGGALLGAAFESRIRDELGRQLSPRHLPDRIIEAPGVPTTLNGKRLEVPVKRLVLGDDPDEVASPESLQDPALFRWFVDQATALRDRPRDR